ncbi:hypothetical protein RYX36_022710 [Vicia faba]
MAGPQSVTREVSGNKAISNIVIVIAMPTEAQPVCTTGGFKDKGAIVGDVFIISDCAFHDRRIPIPVFDLYGVGSRKAFETPNLVKELNLKVGKLSTGDSLDMFTRRPIPIIRNRLKLPKQLTI